MQLILAIDSDPRRSEQLANLVRGRLSVDLVQATSAGEGLHALGDRVPDLILTSPLLSPFDDGVLDEYLRDLGAAAGHVQTVRIPMLSSGPKKTSAAGRLFALGRKKKPTSSAAAPDGCDPRIFADEIAHYLTRSAEQRAASGKPKPADTWQTAAPPAPVDEPPVPELIEEFVEAVYESDPIEAAPPIEAEPHPAFVETLSHLEVEPVIETTYVETPSPLVPEPVYTRPVESPETIVHAETYVSPDPIIKAEPPIVSQPMAPASATSASFEAALAAIRAAWVKPEAKKDEPTPPNGAVNGRPKTLGAGSGDVDLTRAIDALEDVPSAHEEPSPDDTKTPAPHHKGDKAKKRPEKGRGRKMGGPDGRDEWGVFDPKQCGFSALVDKLDEVTEDEVTGRTDVNVR